MPVSAKAVKAHQTELSQCCLCPDMIGPVITGEPSTSKIIQIGQAPGIHEGRVGKPFGWTAGKTLFKWYESIGIDEDTFRKNVYMAAVCRCFPGKNPKGGDRVPTLHEIEQCRPWFETELQLLKPRLIIPVGKLAIQQFLEFDKLTEVIGQQFRIQTSAGKSDCIPLPHPSGASTWHRMEPGKTLLNNALQLIASHPSISKLIRR
ncbi:MAG: uracil-DNA glycosylase family protein [Gammaproteobacteria bacterium]|nr:uracil-DNA glycosylase family protein [Gammaproteobacteria bacterium]